MDTPKWSARAHRLWKLGKLISRLEFLIMPPSNPNGCGNLGLGFSTLFSERPQSFLELHTSPLTRQILGIIILSRNTPIFMYLR